MYVCVCMCVYLHILIYQYIYTFIHFFFFFYISGEEVAVPAKKTKTFVSTSQISQTRQARVEKVINILTKSHLKLTSKEC